MTSAQSPRAADATGATAPTPPDDPEDAARRLLEVVRALVAESGAAGRAGGAARPPTLDSALDRDLGIDSLGRAELVMRIERAFGTRLPEETLASAETPRDLLRAVLRGTTAAAPRAADVVTLAAARTTATPEEATTLLEVLDWHLSHHPSRTHATFLEGDERSAAWSYAELDRAARGVAAGLQAEGIEPGQSVALMLPTSLEFFAAFYGILRAGAVPVPIYPPARPAQLADHMRRQAGVLSSALARLLVTVAEARPLGALLKGQVTTLRRVVTVGDLTARGGAFVPVARAAGDVAFLQYTSGSTGSPKGVILTHANLLANLRAMGGAAGVTSADVFVSWLPLYHDMGLIGAWLGSLYYAMPLVVMSPLDFLARPPRWLWAIHKYRATISAAPNFAYEICATKLDDRDLAGLDLSSWRWAFNGAEPVSADTMERFAARFARYGFDPLSVAPVYGLAECTLDLAFPPARRGLVVDRVDRARLAREGYAAPAAPHDPQPLRVVGCGHPLPGYEIRIADSLGRELPERAVGRVEFKGPSVTSGYFRNPEATARLFDGEWADSGDLGYVAGAELYLTGRAKDMMIRAGQNLYPYELEAAVGNLPGVRKGCVAVFSVPDPARGGERIVVLAETRERDAAAREALRARIDALAVDVLGGPADEVVLAPPHSVLKTSSGKIRRAATRERYQRGELGERAAPLWRQMLALGAASARGRIAASARRLGELVYSGYVWAAFGVLGVAATIAALLLPTAGARRAALHALTRLLVRASGMPVSVSGLERLPAAGSVVVVANHASYVDGLLLYALLPRRFVVAAKEGFARAWFTRRLLGAAGARFVERFDPQRGVADARALAGLAAGGEALAFFPEGTFTRSPGLLPFRMGAFVIAAQTGAPIVPVAFRGTRSALRADSWLVRRTPISVTVGEPIAPTGSDWTAAVRLRDQARAAILRHCGEPDLAERG
jgi:1-acyl-sn-glycerol-3-phosphate acyltransferase